jgi:hypothetical protein
MWDATKELDAMIDSISEGSRSSTVAATAVATIVGKKGVFTSTTVRFAKPAYRITSFLF